jgi:hypothetical protein
MGHRHPSRNSGSLGLLDNRIVHGGNLLTGVTRVDRGSTESQPARMAVKADQKTCR